MLVAELEYSTHWVDGRDDVVFAEEYRHEGELVRRSVHVMKKRGADMGAEQEIF